MTGDYSLDDFLDAGEREDPDGPNDPDDAGEESTDAAPTDASTTDGREPERAEGSDSDTDAEATDADVTDAEVTDTESPDGDAIDPDAVDPAEPTYDWSPDGAECAACGESTTTRWRQDGAYVCADCKEW